MINNTRYRTENDSVYPGEYEPMPWKEKELQHEINRPGARITKPPVNISELADHYKVEMAVPGFKAEDFFINTDGRMLSIEAFNKKAIRPDEEHFHIHNFNWECIQRRITLPANTDTNFVTAEYRNGILNLYFFKSNFPTHNPPGRIIVY